MNTVPEALRVGFFPTRNLAQFVQCECKGIAMSGDLTFDVLHAALNGLAVRQRAIADNIANIDTPGYLSTRTDFEDSLRAMIAGNRDDAVSVVSKSMAPTRTDGNNVDLDTETVQSTETNLRYQAVVEGINMKFKLIRAALGQGG